MQTVVTCWAKVSRHVTYTHLLSGFWDNIRNTANSPHMVLPLPDGAPTNTLSSLL